MTGTVAQDDDVAGQVPFVIVPVDVVQSQPALRPLNVNSKIYCLSFVQVPVVGLTTVISRMGSLYQFTAASTK